MNLNKTIDKRWLSREQELLLRAALLQGQDALDAWQQWRGAVNIENLDPDSYLLLPLLYRNLSVLEVDDPHMVRLKGVYRSTWYRNKILLHKLIDTLRYLGDAGIQTMLFKNTALVSQYYQDYGLRPMYELDILVRQVDVSTAITILQKMGWTSQVEIPDKLSPLSHVLRFENESKQVLNLHWHIFGVCLQDNADDEFWTDAIPIQLDNISAHLLNPTDLLFYICVCGNSWNPAQPASRLADAAMVINASPSEIDWNRLITLAQRYHLILPLKTVLVKLNEVLAMSVPPAVFQTIQNLPISRFERLEYQINRKESLPAVGHFLIRYFLYLRSVNTAELKFKLLGFPRYLQYVWSLEHIGQVPYQVAIRGMKRIFNSSQPKVELVANQASHEAQKIR